MTKPAEGFYVPFQRFCFYELSKKTFFCNPIYYHHGHYLRSFDSIVGHHAWCSFCLFHEKRHVAEVAEVVVEELIPEASSGEHSNLSTIGFAVGFVLMMVLDVVME